MKPVAEHRHEVRELRATGEAARAAQQGEVDLLDQIVGVGAVAAQPSAAADSRSRWLSAESASSHMWGGRWGPWAWGVPGGELGAQVGAVELRHPPTVDLRCVYGVP